MSEQVTDRLVQYIADNGLQPGDILPSEGQLVTRFEVSRPIVREALRTLHGQGIVETSAGKGTVVRSTNAAMLTPYFRHAIQTAQQSTATGFLEARAPIEIATTRAAARNRSEPQLAALSQELQKMASCQEDAAEYARHDALFHILLAQASGNMILAHIIESMHDSLRLVSVEGLSHQQSDDDRARVQEIHGAVLDAVIEGDADKAGAAMEEHFEAAQRFFASAQPSPDSHAIGLD